jgi:hypothetical protein
MRRLILHFYSVVGNDEIGYEVADWLVSMMRIARSSPKETL